MTEAVDAFWAGYLGCQADDLRRPGTTVVAPAGGGLRGYRGAHALRRGPACVVSVPPGWLAWAERALGGREPDAVFAPGALAGAFGDAVERIVGPGYLGYADVAAFRPADERGARVLAAGDGQPDAAALRRLQGACPPGEWEDSGIDPTRPPVFGCFAGGVLVAAGKLQDLDGTLVHVGIITHPARRGRGYGRAVVGAMTARALRGGRVPQYRTLEANAAAVAVARALGYREYGTTLAVRLTAWAPGASGAGGPDAVGAGATDAVVVGDAGPKGLGGFAARSFRRGDVLLRFRGRVVHRDELPSLTPWEGEHLGELTRDTYQVLPPPRCYLNHACDANAVSDADTVYARRDIAAGEEVTLDYRVNAWDDGGVWEMPCRCGAFPAPHVVVGDFFALPPELQAEYAPFAPAFLRDAYRALARRP